MLTFTLPGSLRAKVYTTSRWSLGLVEHGALAPGLARVDCLVTDHGVACGPSAQPDSPPIGRADSIMCCPLQSCVQRRGGGPWPRIDITRWWSAAHITMLVSSHQAVVMMCR